MTPQTSISNNNQRLLNKRKHDDLSLGSATEHDGMKRPSVASTPEVSSLVDSGMTTTSGSLTNKNASSSDQRWALLALILAYSLRKERMANDYSASLQKPRESGMFDVLEARSEDTYIIHFGLTPSAFDSLLDVFEKEYPDKCRTGRPRSFDTRMVLALILMWLRGTMKQETLCIMFGATPATVSRAKRLGLNTLYKVFTDNKYDERWEIRWPSVEEMGRLNEMVLSNARNNPEVLEGVFGYVDGLHLKIECPVDPNEQNAYYNVWKGDTYVSQVIAFNADGCISFVNFNLPGSWHTAHIARPLYNTNLTSLRCPAPYKLLANPDFSRRKEFASKILSVPGKKTKAWRERTVQDKVKYEAIIEHRQDAEWGMRILQASFGRLHSKLPVDKKDRAELLSVIWRLHNFQIRTIGVNKIRTDYYKQWVDVNINSWK
ncbi:unnamed protein product [Mucor hiemalis]